MQKKSTKELRNVSWQCPAGKGRIRPARCLTCEYYGGVQNSGVLCFRANRWFPYTKTA